MSARNDVPTARQLQFLADLGCDVMPESKAQAGALIAKLAPRRPHRHEQSPPWTEPQQRLIRELCVEVGAVYPSQELSVAAANDFVSALLARKRAGLLGRNGKVARSDRALPGAAGGAAP